MSYPSATSEPNSPQHINVTGPHTHNHYHAHQHGDEPQHSHDHDHLHDHAVSGGSHHDHPHEFGEMSPGRAGEAGEQVPGGLSAHSSHQFKGPASQYLKNYHGER